MFYLKKHKKENKYNIIVFMLCSFNPGITLSECIIIIISIIIMTASLV